MPEKCATSGTVSGVPNKKNAKCQVPISRGTISKNYIINILIHNKINNKKLYEYRD